MAFFIFIFFIVAWVFAMQKVAASIIKMIKTPTRAKQILLTFCLSIAPFAHELYVYYGFQAYCSVYGGITKLKPVRTDALAFDQKIVTTYRLLMLTALKQVQYLGDDREQVSSLSLSKDQSLCRLETHQSRLNSRFPQNKEMAQIIINDGYCYSSETLSFEPRYLLTLGAPEKFEYKTSQSFFYPRLIGQGQPVQIIDRSDGSIQSSYTSLATHVGFLAHILMPMAQEYKCPTTHPAYGRGGYRFDNNIYGFLQKAIEAGD